MKFGTAILETQSPSSVLSVGHGLMSVPLLMKMGSLYTRPDDSYTPSQYLRRKLGDGLLRRVRHYEPGGIAPTRA